jgi:hypothetical protein
MDGCADVGQSGINPKTRYSACGLNEVVFVID